MTTDHMELRTAAASDQRDAEQYRAEWLAEGDDEPA